jgi:hypothetical protein
LHDVSFLGVFIFLFNLIFNIYIYIFLLHDLLLFFHMQTTKFHCRNFLNYLLSYWEFLILLIIQKALLCSILNSYKIKEIQHLEILILFNLLLSLFLCDSIYLLLLFFFFLKKKKKKEILINLYLLDYIFFVLY